MSAADRFPFGRNWRDFLEHVDSDRVAEAQRSLVEMLGPRALEGRRFLDAGCGSGLFSLAARRLGADVTSFDFDPEAVACALELKRRFAPGDAQWAIHHGSVLDPAFLQTLGQFDVVYSWGVLHHTGNMWRSLENVLALVKENGQIFVALYNDQGLQSTAWRIVKRLYNRLPRPLQPAACIAVAMPLETAAFGSALLRGRPRDYVQSRRHYRSRRGMSWWHDLVDWVGGYPFEVAKPTAVTQYCGRRGFVVLSSRTVGSKLGCNEFVFRRLAGKS